MNADLREPEKVLAAPQLRDTLDLSRPVALTLFAVLQHVVDDQATQKIIAGLTEPLAPGSTMALSAVTNDSSPEDGPRAVAAYNSSGVPVKARDRAGVEALFDGWDLVDPGVTLVHRWRPDPADQELHDDQVYMYGGVAIKRDSR